jgi:hypothetical protein
MSTHAFPTAGHRIVTRQLTRNPAFRTIPPAGVKPHLLASAFRLVSSRPLHTSTTNDHHFRVTRKLSAQHDAS